jgi:hypothetical protein
MKTYQFTIEVYVLGETEADAAANLIDEMDYLIGVDNMLTAYTHPKSGEEVTE